MAAQLLSSKNLNSELLRNLLPGDLIEIPRGNYSHWAVYKGNEQVVHVAGLDGGNIPSAVHHVSSVFGPRYPKAEVRVDSFWDAVKNSKALKNNILDGEMKPLPGTKIVKNACSRIGAATYNLLHENCEHFATWCRYGVSKSVQADTFLLALGIGTAVVAAIVVGYAGYRLFKYFSAKRNEEKQEEKC